MVSSPTPVASSHRFVASSQSSVASSHYTAVSENPSVTLVWSGGVMISGALKARYQEPREPGASNAHPARHPEPDAPGTPRKKRAGGRANPGTQGAALAPLEAPETMGRSIALPILSSWLKHLPCKC